jgi:diguanylate cyclase (GGDEF)-like protein
MDVMGIPETTSRGPRPPCRRRLHAGAPLLAVLIALQAAPPPAAATDAATPSASAASAAGPQEERLLQFEFEGRAQPEEAAARLLAWLDTLPPDAPQRPFALELLGWWRSISNDPDGNERAAHQLEQLGQQVPAWRARCQAGAAMVRAKLASRHGSLARAERLMTEAIDKLPADVPPRQRLRYLQLAGEVRARAGKYDEAVRWTLQAMNLADSSAPKWQRSEIRSQLAYWLYQVGQKDRAAALNKEALVLGREGGDDLSQYAARTTEAILRAGAHQDDQELHALRAAIEHARRAGARREEVMGMANVADYYLQRGQYATALDTTQRALPLARELRNSIAESLALTNMGLALVSLHRKEEGMRHLQAALAIEERSGSLANMADTWREMGIYLERAGELKDAFEAFKQYRRLSEEVFRQEQQQVILELQEGYDNQRRNRELDLLNRENRLKDEQLLQRELQQRLWAVAAALGVLSVSVIVLLLQRARRANRLLACTNEQLKVQSERDPLTGLANRRHLQQLMRRPDGETQVSGTFYLLDVDHFKQINDVHGHAVGDQVLIETARRLRTVLREQDVVVRWGGEEFLVVVQALSPDRIEALAQRLLHTLGDEPVATSSGPVPVTASIGFATFPLQPGGVALGWEQAIELVDTAMYLAKAHGRNRAYGVRRMEARSAQQVREMSQSLEQRWQHGEVALTLLQGPATVGAAA